VAVDDLLCVSLASAFDLALILPTIGRFVHGLIVHGLTDSVLNGLGSLAKGFARPVVTFASGMTSSLGSSTRSWVLNLDPSWHTAAGKLVSSFRSLGWTNYNALYDIWGAAILHRLRQSAPVSAVLAHNSSAAVVALQRETGLAVWLLIVERPDAAMETLQAASCAGRGYSVGTVVLPSVSELLLSTPALALGLLAVTTLPSAELLRSSGERSRLLDEAFASIQLYSEAVQQLASTGGATTGVIPRFHDPVFAMYTY